jgi:hypothetical protein
MGKNGIHMNFDAEISWGNITWETEEGGEGKHYDEP